MRIYSQLEEETIRAHAAVREWHRSGFLDAAQATRLASDLHIDLRRTNFFLRAISFLFSAVAVVAGVSLIVKVADAGDSFVAIICIIAAALCIASTESLIQRFRFYRYGVEEAFAFAAPILLSIGVALIASRSGDFQFSVGVAAGALGFLGIFLRYGYVYSAIAALICAAAVPLPLVRTAIAARLLAAALCTLTFLVARRRRTGWGDDYPGDEYSIVQAGAWVGIYLALNLQLGFDSYYKQDLLYWSTYLMIWLLPIIGLRLALPSKDRPLMNVSAAMALATLITNKPYLHLQRQPWDPILLGLLLTSVAILAKRWLAAGPTGRRRGFTAVRLLARDQRSLTFVSTASAALQPQIPEAPVKAADPNFGGGRSGGAGASGSF